ncbi:MULTISPECIES: histidine phosphatase family protein [Paenibacillus]|uniref:histidine phosphatase family protein n=1 Tax=Paenibacillus TaxID=44249 RepID=UPI00096DD1BF|nr:histidine phosphatase family protein [Paenibacillus peoriae]MCP3748023.1 histidine phosphatase family protein [Paenibacillus sp. A3M_27_13]OMF73381.1 histidine phosphatase family protein [Paenibacillus peoriae]
MKKIYFVRHAQATGQEPDARLTDEGTRQAEQLADFMENVGVEYIVSSPWIRAVRTIQPLAERRQLQVYTDLRLQERVLSGEHLDHWLDVLEQTYLDEDLKLEGGESSREAADRGIQLVQELIERAEKTVIIVTHGALLSLLIRHYDPQFGFEEWKKLSNPDIYLLELKEAEAKIHRVWNTG